MHSSTALRDPEEPNVYLGAAVGNVRDDPPSEGHSETAMRENSVREKIRREIAAVFFDEQLRHLRMP
jgi:hypothetical protein